MLISTSCQKELTSEYSNLDLEVLANAQVPYNPPQLLTLASDYNNYYNTSFKIGQTNSSISLESINGFGSKLTVPSDQGQILLFENGTYEAIQEKLNETDSLARLEFHELNNSEGAPFLSQSSVDKINEVLLAIQYSSDGLQYAVKRVQSIVNNYSNTVVNGRASNFTMERATVTNVLNMSLAYGMHLYDVQKQYNSFEGLPPTQNDPTNPMRLACKVNWGNVWRGAVIGGVIGAVAGAKAGLAGGTVALPGVGSVTGAVGGGVFGFVGGYVGGAATSTVAELMATCFRGYDPTKVKYEFNYPTTIQTVNTIKFEIYRINAGTLPLTLGQDIKLIAL